MPNFSTDGLVIRTQSTKEQDRLITILTRDNGVLRAFSPRALKINSKNLSSSELLSYSHFVIYKGRDTYKISDSRPIEMFFKLRSDIVSFTLAEYICELLYYLAPVDESADSYLRLTLNALHLLCSRRLDPRLIKATAELKIAEFSGYMPDLTGCHGCGEAVSADGFFDVQNGTLLCGDCVAGRRECMALSAGVLAAMRHILTAPESRLFGFSLGEESMQQLAAVAELFLLTQTDRRYKSLEFYKTLSGF